MWLTEESLADRERLSTSSDTEDRLQQENTFTIKLCATMCVVCVLVSTVPVHISRDSNKVLYTSVVDPHRL